MIDAFVSALVDAAMRTGGNRDALEAAIRSIVVANMDAIKRETSTALTLQGWVPPQPVGAHDVAKVLPKGVTINPKLATGMLRDLGGGNVGVTGLDMAQMSPTDRANLDRIKYKFIQPPDQDALVLKTQYRAQYDNGTLFEI